MLPYESNIFKTINKVNTLKNSDISNNIENKNSFNSRRITTYSNTTKTNN